MISFVNVYLKYTKEFYALSNISFEGKAGEVVAFIGPEDSGKTSILRLLAGLEKADKGEIYVKDISIDKLDYENDISMGYLPFNTSFFEKKTVYQNLEYVLLIRQKDKNAIKETIDKVVIDFKLESIIDNKIYTLSPYQKYIVSIARLCLRENFDCVMIDNIFEKLTAEQTKNILKLIKKYFVKSKTLVLLATSSEEVAKNLATKKIYLSYGAIDKVV